MHKSILSELERRRIRAFNKADGEKSSAIRGLTTRCQKYLPKIKEDLALIEEFLQHYKPRSD
jgi:hypothetical protein